MKLRLRKLDIDEDSIVVVLEYLSESPEPQLKEFNRLLHTHLITMI